MNVDDLDAVAEMESRAYEFPWSAGIFSDCLRVGYRCDTLVSESGAVAGYCIMAVAAGEAHILNLCVDAHLRRRGLGQRLLRHLLDCAQRAKCFRIFLEVRPSNLAALALYERSGFSRLSIRRDYYRASEGREDAIVLSLSLR